MEIRHIRSIALTMLVAAFAGWMETASGQEQNNQAAVAALPNPKTGGQSGGPIAILFLSWHPAIDKTYMEDLEKAGFAWASADYKNPIDPAFIRKFNVFVFDDLPHIDYEYRPWMKNYYSAIREVRKCVAEGAGMLVHSSGASGRVASVNKEFSKWGMQIRMLNGVRDPSLEFNKWKAYVENGYCWTERLEEKHPVTNGLCRIYYPSGELNGTGVYASRAIECDSDWTPLVKTMPGAMLYNVRIGEKNPAWHVQSTPDEFVIAACRQAGKGRLGVIAITSEYFQRGGYGHGKTCYELKLGNVDGTMLKKGNGVVPSDMWGMLTNLYAWLAGDSGKHNLGGYKQGEEVPYLDSFDHLALYKDEAADKRYKALIGARSSYSDGRGTVEEYAVAAKAAGYSAIIFTENFETFEEESWPRFVADCKRYTSNDLVCIPGFEITDVDNNHFLMLSPPYYPRAYWLDESGKKLVNPYTPNFEYYSHMIVAHRPASSPLPVERLKHFQGLSVYTYRDGKLIDNSLNEFIWEVRSASFPVPIAVHEIYAPGELDAAARTGFQQYLPLGSSPRDAVRRFCGTGMQNPTHPVISEGPVISHFAPVQGGDVRIQGKNPDRPKSEQSFQVEIAVESEVPLKQITLYDGYRPLRRWKCSATEFKAVATLPFTHQYAMYVMAEDAKGRKALKSDFWISAGSLRPRSGRFPGIFRCTDRQNWLGHTPIFYTGALLPKGAGGYFGMRLPVIGMDEGRGIFNGMHGACMAVKVDFPLIANDLVVSEYILDEKYVDATFNETGLAARRSFASKASSLYEGRVCYYSFLNEIEGEPWVAMVDVDLTLRRGAEPMDPQGLFPAIDRYSSKKSFRWDGEKIVTGMIENISSAVPIPAGSLCGGIIPLDAGFALYSRHFGIAIPQAADYLPAGTRIRGRYLLPGRSSQVGNYDKVKKDFEDAPEAWLRAIGLAGPTPYEIKMTQGRMEEIAFLAPMQAKDYGVAGEVTKTADIPYQVPLKVTGVNSRWSAGIWREGQPAEFVGIYKSDAWARLDVSKKGAFYAGNLLLAEAPMLILSLAKWDAKTIRFEAHNRSEQPITTTISTPVAVKGLKAFKRKVTIQAGTSVMIDG